MIPLLKWHGHPNSWRGPPIATYSPTAPEAVSERRRFHVLGRGLSRGTGLALSVVVLVAVAVVSLSVGARDVDLASVVGAFVDFDASSEHVIVRELRLPRLLAGIVAGAALALAGMLMQGLTRNPVADPGILGVSAGAAFCVVLAIVLGFTDAAGYLWFALLGAGIASLLVYVLGSVGGGRGSPAQLTLAGAVMTALVTAMTMTILILDDATLDRYRFWDVGSLAGRDLGSLMAVIPVMLVGGLIALSMGRALNTMSMGDDLARTLGMRLLPVRAAAGIGVVLLAGSAVAIAGPIVFVGLAVPHMARALVGPDYRWIALYSLILGPILLVAADTIGRLVIRPGELQVGIVTALLGAPLFIALVRRRGLAEV